MNATTDTATLYSISIPTGTMTPVGTAGAIAFTTDGVTVVDLPDPATVGYGVDFNPAADRVRVVAGALNFRVNPNTGAGVDGNNGGAVATGTNPDGAINGGTTGINATAYTNNQPNNGGITTQYTLDGVSNSLYIQNPPNSGTQTLVQSVTLGGAALDFTVVAGFDIPSGVNTAASNGPVAAGSGLAVLSVGGVTSLYSINLVNAQATLLGPVGTGALAIQGSTFRSDIGGLPAIALDSTGAGVAALQRFVTSAPGTITTVAVSGLPGNEQLVGIDWRPATGQLFGLGVNATADTATLYLVDPQTGALSAVGAASQITFGGVDFTDPATTGFGFDFNPTVDRVRVATSTGLNFRVNPVTGAPAAQDGAINGSGATGVSGAAYTNSFAGATATTLYTLDSVTRSLYIQNPPNNGTQASALGTTLGGGSLTFGSIGGFDIAASVSVATSNAAAVGSGFAVLTVGGVTGLYQINLATGAVTSLGVVGVGATPLFGLALGDGP